MKSQYPQSYYRIMDWNSGSFKWIIKYVTISFSIFKIKYKNERLSYKYFL